jgi:serine/threonine protein phosphatase PrpC
VTDIPTTDPSPSATPLPAAGAATPERGCPICGATNPVDASFCEECGTDLTGAPSGLPQASALPQAGALPQAVAAAGMPQGGDGVQAAATPQTAPAGEESPLDVGWTGPVASRAVETTAADEHPLCQACGRGHVVDGYCDQCGTPPPDPRFHVVDAPASWVGGVSDIGRRHTRNEDAIALRATDTAGGRAVLVVSDGVSMATDSHIASLAAALAARGVLEQPFPRGAGTPGAWSAAAGRALTAAVTAADDAVSVAVEDDVPNPPSCTIALAVVEDGVVVAGNVGDSRVYWLPDDDSEPAAQLGRDDSFAQEQILAGVPRTEAENGPQAHSITRWLGKDSPDDLTPHLTTFVATAGWLMICSDGLWNYCSEAEDLRALLRHTIARVGDDPTALSQALVDFANEQGGRDNITVALARLAGQGSTDTHGVGASAAPEEGAPSDG